MGFTHIQKVDPGQLDSIFSGCHDAEDLDEIFPREVSHLAYNTCGGGGPFLHDRWNFLHIIMLDADHYGFCHVDRFGVLVG